VLEELSILIRMQEIDNQLKELDDEKGDLPEQIERLKGRLETLSTAIADLDAVLNEKTTEKSDVQKELRESQEQSEKSQAIIFSVKTSKEYDAVTAEIEQSKDKIIKNERRLEELRAEINALENELIEKHSEVAQIQSEYDGRDKEMQEKLGETQDEILELSHARETEVMKLKKPVMAHYERIRKIRDGIGVAHIVGDACSYCYSVLPPQRKAEVRKMEDLILCEVCGCILVSDEFSEKLDRLY
jgi:hypothetical protein